MKCELRTVELQCSYLGVGELVGIVMDTSMNLCFVVVALRVCASMFEYNVALFVHAWC